MRYKIINILGVDVLFVRISKEGGWMAEHQGHRYGCWIDYTFTDDESGFNEMTNILKQNCEETFKLVMKIDAGIISE